MKLGILYDNVYVRVPSKNILSNIFLEFDHIKFDKDIYRSEKDIHDFFKEVDIAIFHHYSFKANYYGGNIKENILNNVSNNFRFIIKNQDYLIDMAQKSDCKILLLFIYSDWRKEENFWKSLPKNSYIFGGIESERLNPNAKPEPLIKYPQDIRTPNRCIPDNRIIPIRHVLSDDELSFCNKCIHERKYDISVLGAMYERRKKVYSILKRSDLKLYNNKPLLRLRKILNRFDNKKNKFNHVILNYLYKHALCNSKISYADGSQLDMFVRKFIEIPAMKSVLLCHPYLGMEDHGFKENIHYVKLDNERPIDQIRELLNKKEFLFELSENAYSHVKNTFSISILKPKIEKILNKLSNGDLESVYWKNGNLIIKEKTKDNS